MEITHSEKMKNIENIMKNGPSQLPGIPGIAPPGGANGGIEECLDWEILEICRRNLLLWTELSKVKGENRGLRKMLTGQQIVIDKLEYEFAQLQYECARISHLCIHKHKHLESNLEEAEADIQTLSDECNNLNNENESYSKKVVNRTEELFTTKRELSEIKDENQSLLEQNAVLMAENSRLKVENETYKDKISKLDKFRSVAERFADHYGKQRLYQRKMKYVSKMP